MYESDLADKNISYYFLINFQYDKLSLILPDILVYFSRTTLNY